MLINTKKLGQQVAEYLGQSLALLLRSYGVIVVGGSIEEVLVKCICFGNKCLYLVLCFYFEFTTADQSGGVKYT